MKKALVITGICLGGILLLAVAGILVLMQPGIQKKIVLGAFAKEHHSANLEHFQAKGGKLSLSGLKLENQAYSLEIRELDARGDVSLLALLLGKEPDLEHVAIQGIRFEFKDNQEWKPGRGLRGMFSPQTPFRIGSLDADASILYKGINANVQITGADLASGESGEVNWEATGNCLGEGLESNGRLDIAFNEEGILAKFEPDFTIGIQGGPILGARVAVEFSEGVEVFKSFVTLAGNEDGEAVKLLEIQGTNQQSASRMELAIKGSLSPETIGQLDIDATAKLPQGLHLDLDFQGVMESGEWLMDRGHLEAAMDGGKLGVDLLQSFKLDTGKLQLSELPQGSKVLEINTTVPAHWVFKEKWVTGPPLEASFVLNSLPNGFEISTEKPLVWHALKWMGNGSQEGAPFDISGLPKLVRDQGRHLFQVDALRLASPDSSLVDGEFSAQKPGKAKPWQWEAEAITQTYSLENLLRKTTTLPILFFRPGEQAKFKASGEFEGNEATVSSGNIEIASKWTQPWITARVNQPFKFIPVGDGQWKLGTYGRLLELDTTDFELDRLGKVVPELQFSTSPVNSHWALANEEGQGLRLSTREPLSIDNVSVAWDGVSYVHRGLLSGSVRFGISPSWELAFEDLRLGTVQDPLATGSFAFYDPKAELPWRGRVNINLPRASRSVLFSGQQGTVKSGVCRLGVGKREKGGRTSMEISLRDVVLEDFPDDHLDLNVGIRFRNAEDDPFDLDFQTGEDGAKASKGRFVVKGNQSYGLAVEALHLGHIKQAVALYTAWWGGKGPKEGNKVPKGLPEFAFHAKAGKFYVGNGDPLEDLEILVNSSENRFSLDKFSAKSGEGGIQGFAHYRPAKPGTESNLVADIQAKGIPTQDLQPPPKEGKPTQFAGLLDLHATMEARGGDNLEMLLERAEVDLNADLKKGHYFFTQLDSKFDTMLAATDKVQQAGNTVGSLPLGGILGETAENLANVAQQATNIVGAGGDLLGKFLNIPEVRNTLTKIEYDTMSLTARREPIGKTHIETFQMRGPVISIDAQGEIGKMPLWQIQDGPLTLDMHLGTKGDLESFFGGIGQLAPSYTTDGYRHFKANPVQIKGTLAKPRLRNLWKVIFPGNYAAPPEEPARKEYYRERTPGIYPGKSSLRKAFEGGIPFLPF